MAILFFEEMRSGFKDEKDKTVPRQTDEAWIGTK